MQLNDSAAGSRAAVGFRCSCVVPKIMRICILEGTPDPNAESEDRNRKGWALARGLRAVMASDGRDAPAASVRLLLILALYCSRNGYDIRDNGHGEGVLMPEVDPSSRDLLTLVLGGCFRKVGLRKRRCRCRCPSGAIGGRSAWRYLAHLW